MACCGEKPIISETALNALFGLIFKPLREERQDELCSVFMVKILTCPALIYHLNKIVSFSFLIYTPFNSEQRFNSDE